MVELFLTVLKRYRKSRYRGIGIRGGFVLAVLWAVLCGLAGLVGWSVANTLFAASAGLVVGYRLEGVGGAIAVAVLIGLYWSIVASAGWPPGLGAIFGFVMGLVIGAATTE